VHVWIVTRAVHFRRELCEHYRMSANPESWARDENHADKSLQTFHRIRAILLKHGKLGTDAGQLAETDDLYAAGLTSLASVNVMLALEGEFDVEFPDQMLNRSMFTSISTIRAALQKAAGP
jgi:acyl carrier protein